MNSESAPLQVCRDCWKEHIQSFPEPIRKKLTGKDLDFWIHFFRGVKRIQVELIFPVKQGAENRSDHAENGTEKALPTEKAAMEHVPPEAVPPAPPPALLAEERLPETPPDPGTILEARLAEVRAEYRALLEKELDAWDRQKIEMKKGRISEAIEREIEKYKRNIAEIEQSAIEIEAELEASRDSSKTRSGGRTGATETAGDKNGNRRAGKKTSFIKSLFK